MLLAEQQGRDVPVNTDYRTHGLGHWRRRRYGHLVLVSLDHLDIVDYYEGDGQGFAPLLRWLDERGYHGTDWCPHDAKDPRGGVARSAHADRNARHAGPQA
jgi:hypothetical protein